MCARYALFGPFGGASLVPGFVEHVVNPLAGFAQYNIAPSQVNPVVVAGPAGPGLESMRWGLLPHWAKVPKLAYSTLNARAETLVEKPAFREAWRRGQAQRLQGEAEPGSVPKGLTPFICCECSPSYTQRSIAVPAKHLSGPQSP